MKGVLTTVAVLVLALCAATAHGATHQLQHVTLIGDSVADAIPGDNQAVATLRQGIDLDLEVEPCRRVDQESCPNGNVRPPNVVQLAQMMGSKLGPNVVVSVGYNDFEDQYAQNIENALAAFKAAGVKHVWWLTLRAAHHPYINMNDDIQAAATQHPELSVIDWNVYSRSHPDWFQADGLHLLGPGAEAMAGLIHKTLLDDGVASKPVQVATTALPTARIGRSYAAKLGAAQGLAPFRWSLLERAPKGLHLEADGRIMGRPRARPGTYVLNVRVTDSAGSFATRRLTLRIKR
jgi:Putative Ig domain